MEVIRGVVRGFFRVDIRMKVGAGLSGNGVERSIKKEAIMSGRLIRRIENLVGRLFSLYPH